jgi:hypothetical protein
MKRRLAACIGVGAALLAAGSAMAATSTSEVTVTGGELSISTSNFQPKSVTLDGTNQTLSTSATSAWTAVDARGTGAPWTVAATSTDLVSTLTSSPNRVIPSSRIAFTTGTVTAGAGADAASGITGSTAAPFTNSASAATPTSVTVLDAAGPHRGSYSVTPSLDIQIPANAAPSYTGAGSTPYTATLTVTIA